VAASRSLFPAAISNLGVPHPRKSIDQGLLGDSTVTPPTLLCQQVMVGSRWSHVWGQDVFSRSVTAGRGAIFFKTVLEFLTPILEFPTEVE